MLQTLINVPLLLNHQIIHHVGDIFLSSRTAPVLAPLDRQVSPLKQKRITSAALRYLGRKNMAGREVFFDIVSVTYEGGATTVKYFPQAWIPLYV